jgi:hypothetical protein
VTGIPDIAAIIGRGEWFAHRYDPEHDAVHFVRMSRQVQQNATFLTDEYLPAGLETVVVARKQAIDAMPAVSSPHFIFHSAFCCSTVLARAFDIPGVSMGLKEPPIFNDVVGWRHRGGGPPARVAQVIDNAVSLLARPLAPGETTIIKPSNLANGLARGTLAMHAESNALLLYAPLPIYLRSIAKKEMTGRLWVRDLLVKLLRENLVNLPFESTDYLAQTDLQVAAVGWLAQQALFARLVSEFGKARVRTLDSETLLARPSETVRALSVLYGLGLTVAQIEAIETGPAFSKHSKSDVDFGTKDRAREYDDAILRHGDEIAKVTIWAEAVARSADIPMWLPSALLA